MPLLPRIPPIRVRGVRQVVPTGHVVGRLSAGDGAAELIPFAALGGALIAGGGVGPTPQTQYDTLGFTAPGLFSAGRIFTLAAETPSSGTIFPSKTRLSTATFGFAPAGNVVFYLVQNLAVFLAMGAPNGAIARINGTAGSGVGTITWLQPTITIPVGQILSLVMPAVADAAFGNVLLMFVGDPS